MKMLMRSVLAGLALAAIVAGAGRASRDADAAGATVAVANFSFTDGGSGTSTTTIQAGDTVTWTWGATSGVPHSTTSDSVPAGAATWDSGTSASPFSFGPTTFTVAGTYTYHCSVHPGTMTGTIVVQAAATATAMATNTPMAATSTPVAATSTPRSATSTPVGDATMPAATSTSVAAASPSPALIAPAPKTPTGAAAGAATQTALPRAGTGTSGGGSNRGMWLTIALGALAAAAIGGAVVVRARRSARR